MKRRDFLHVSAGLTLGGLASASEKPDLYLAAFRFDVTPPVGHSLCGGWIKPVEAVDDLLEAIGFVLLGAGQPIVICTVDWTGLLNDAHVAWRSALAEAAGTTPQRVAVQCVHQHNAPFACLDAQKFVAKHADLPHIVDLDFFKTCLDRGRTAVRECLTKARRVTHVASGQAKVDRVAANRRVQRDEKKNVLAMRGSSCNNAALRDRPEGLIDPWLKTVTFFDKDTPIAACHYYATHPMSYYGDGRVSSDFVGLARKQRQKEVPGCHRLYFTGCAGDVAAGKYNDGSPPMRAVLAKRIHDAMVESEKAQKPEPIGSIQWADTPVVLPTRAEPTVRDLEMLIGNGKLKTVGRNLPAYRLAWRERSTKSPIVLSALSMNAITLLHLPAECFVEYQLRAQAAQPKRFVATAAYGDGGPWYLPTAEEYPCGGYEVGVAFCPPEADAMLTKGIKTLLN